MAISATKLTALKKKQSKEVIIPQGEITFLNKIELSAQSAPITGVIQAIGRTKTGNFRYVCTSDNGHFKFFAKEELSMEVVEAHSFGIQKMDDGKELYWY